MKVWCLPQTVALQFWHCNLDCAGEINYLQSKLGCVTLSRHYFYGELSRRHAPYTNQQ
ncbi:MAG: hypothetical protein KME26_09230 [Oscillatoria princeps RMCB-10]|nr:hypothetical protein [Oscillatoria princeps RMCB-10]